MRRCEGLVDASQRARNITAQKIDKIMAETEGDEKKIPKKLTVSCKVRCRDTGCQAYIDHEANRVRDNNGGVRYVSKFISKRSHLCKRYEGRNKGNS